MNIGRSGQWRPAVHPYLEEIAEQVKAKGRSEHSMTVELRGIKVLISPLEQDLLLALAGEGGESFARKHVLVRDSLGLRLKLLAELKRLKQVDSAQRDEVLSQINADVGLGCQLMHEITLEMNAITAAGAIEEARDFSQYRAQLTRLVDDAERLVSGRADSGSRLAALRNGYSPHTPTSAGAGSQGASRQRTSPTAAKASGSKWIVLSVGLLITALAVVSWMLFLR